MSKEGLSALDESKSAGSGNNFNNARIKKIKSFFFFFAVMIAWGADVSSSHKEYQNILKDYQQNLVICSCIGVEITWNFV